MSTMKVGLYTKQREIALQEVERQAPRPGYVVLEMLRSGICGSDLHEYRLERDVPQPYATGHEICGKVVEIGEGVSRVKLGDRAVAECFSHCGECVYCRTGQYNHCHKRLWYSQESHGGFSEYVTAHESSLFVVPDSISDEEGALVEPLAVAHRALMLSEFDGQDRIAIIGGGTIGQLCLAVAVALGARETLITVKYPQQVELAKKLGATHIVDITETDTDQAIAEWTGELGADVVIETAGGAANFDTALRVVRKMGRMVLLAIYMEAQEVDLMNVIVKEPTIIGSNCYAYSGLRTDFDAAIELIESGRVDPTLLVTHRYAMDEIVEAFAVSDDKGSGVVKAHLYR